GPLTRGSYLSRQANAAATAPAVRSQLPDFAGLIHPLPSPTPSTADDFALSKAISRQHRGGDGFAVRPKTALLPSMRANPARRPARTGAGRRAVLRSAAGNAPNADAIIPPVCEPAHIGWRRRVSSLGPQGPGGSHGKQDASRPLRRHDDARALPHVPQSRTGRFGVPAGSRSRRGSKGEGNQRLDANRHSVAARANRLMPGRSEFQRPRLLHLRQRAYGGEHLRGQGAVDL